MRSFQIGVVLQIAQFGPERTTPRWTEGRDVAMLLEEAGVDTLWTPDELLWLPEDRPPLGIWEGVRWPARSPRSPRAPRWARG